MQSGMASAKESSFRGGARIGWVNASWPFAKLTVSAGRLAITSLGSFEFSPSQVISIEPHGSIPLLASGIRVIHNRTDCPEKIIFWCTGNRDSVLRAITQNGFMPTGRPAERAAGFPIRWSVVIAVIALWNVLLMLDQWTKSPAYPPGGFAVLAVLAVLVFATVVRISPRMQHLVLREGHQVGEIKAFLGLL